jgi:hypothetical protein
MIVRGKISANIDRVNQFPLGLSQIRHRVNPSLLDLFKIFPLIIKRDFTVKGGSNKKNFELIR